MAWIIWIKIVDLFKQTDRCGHIGSEIRSPRLRRELRDLMGARFLEDTWTVETVCRDS